MPSGSRPSFGLSTEALKAEIRKSNVSSVTETGINEDAAHTRVTFRYRTRAWIRVVDPDGTMIERILPMWMPRQHTSIA